MKAIILFFFFLASLWLLEPAQASFYQGKTVTIISGTTAGSAYDTYARLFASHLGKHVPGNPGFMVQNMPGGGSMVAANFLYGVAKPDGLTIASINPALYFNQLAGRKEVQFDWAKFQWLGSPDWSDHVLYMRTDTPYKTIHDVRTASTPPKCTATATGTTGHYLPKLLEETMGTKFNIILGYPGGPEMDLAVERNEAQCRAFTTHGLVQRRALRELAQEWLRSFAHSDWPQAGRALVRRAHPLRAHGTVQDRGNRSAFGGCRARFQYFRTALCRSTRNGSGASQNAT